MVDYVMTRRDSSISKLHEFFLDPSKARDFASFQIEDLARLRLLSEKDMLFFKPAIGDSPEMMRAKFLKAYIYAKLALVLADIDKDFSQLQAVGQSEKLHWANPQTKVYFKTQISENIKRMKELVESTRRACFGPAEIKAILFNGKVLTGFIRNVAEKFYELIESVERSDGLSDAKLAVLCKALKANAERFRSEELAVLGNWTARGPERKQAFRDVA